MLPHADAVRCAYESELELRQVERKFDRLDRKVALGHENLAEFRDKTGAELQERESAARTHLERKRLLDRMAKTLDWPGAA